MGFFDRLKKQKKRENQEENKMGQELSASEKLSTDLQRQINDLYKEKNDAYQEQMNGWYKTEQEIQGQLDARSDLDTTKYLDDVVAKQAKEVMTEMSEDEDFSKRAEPPKDFNKSRVTAEKAKAINKQISIVNGGVLLYVYNHPTPPFLNPLNYLGLTFLLTKEQLGILEGAEEQNLNYARNHMTDEELGEYLEKELAIVKKYRAEDKFNTVEQQKILDFAIGTADNFLDSLHTEKSQSRR